MSDASGTASAVAQLREEFQKLERSPSGSRAEVAGWTLIVDEELHELGEQQISIPRHAWGIVGAVFAGATDGSEPNPWGFSRMGYIS
jgi:hypothetical protein